MIHFHCKRMVAAFVLLLIICFLVILLLYHCLGEPIKTSNIDPELLRLLAGDTEKPLEGPTIAFKPQIHVKQLVVPSLTVSINMSYYLLENNFFSMKEPEIRRSRLIEFRRLGIGGKNEISKEGWTLKTLGTHLKDEGYWGIPVDYVKIDIEYTEWVVLKTAFAEGALQNIKQLGFEIHTKSFLRRQNETENTLFEKFTQREKEMEEKLSFVHMFETLHQVEILNFRKFNYRKNPFGNYMSKVSNKERSCCYELHFVNLDFITPDHTVIHREDSKLFH